jgi:hypothetical protein
VDFLISPQAETQTAAPPSVDDRLRCEACGKVHSHAKLVKLFDGREVGNYSKEWRLHCEAKYVLRIKRSKRTRMEYLDAVEQRRGLEAKLELRAEMLRIYEARKK